MLSSTALGVPRFSITRDRRSSSTRRRSLPKFARARKAETTMVPFLPGVVVATNSPFQLSELYSLRGVAVNDYWSGYVITSRLRVKVPVAISTFFVRHIYHHSQQPMP